MSRYWVVSKSCLTVNSAWQLFYSYVFLPTPLPSSSALSSLCPNLPPPRRLLTSREILVDVIEQHRPESVTTETDQTARHVISLETRMSLLELSWLLGVEREKERELDCNTLLGLLGVGEHIGIRYLLVYVMY